MSNMVNITKLLRSVLPNHKRIQDRCPLFGHYFEDLAPEYGLVTKKRIIHFWAQMLHETGGLKWLEELGGVSYFKKYEPGTRIGKRLGNTETGDGYKYRGRGLIHLTGRYNYRLYNKLISNESNILDHPRRASDADIAVEVAMLYWKRKALNVRADEDDIRTITKKINGGFNGFQDRKKWLSKLDKAYDRLTSESEIDSRPVPKDRNPLGAGAEPRAVNETIFAKVISFLFSVIGRRH